MREHDQPWVTTKNWDEEEEEEDKEEMVAESRVHHQEKRKSRKQVIPPDPNYSESLYKRNASDLYNDIKNSWHKDNM